jgi:hypothetical protein
MLKKTFVGVMAGGLILVCMTIAVQAADCGCGGISSRNYKAMCGPPCYSAPGCGGLSQGGCCECQPTACDNAWDGYCEHKAKVQAYFTKVGTKVGTSRSSCNYGYRYGYGSCSPSMHEVTVEGAASPQLAPNPAIRPVAPNPAPVNPPAPPAPAAEKTSRAKVMYPWAR